MPPEKSDMTIEVPVPWSSKPMIIHMRLRVVFALALAIAAYYALALVF